MTASRAGSRRSLTHKIIQQALSLGFDAAGVADAEGLSTDETALEQWLARGFQGGMGYMARDPKRRSRPESVLPGARSVIVLAMNYAHSDHNALSPKPDQGRVSRYAWGRDYHGVIEPRLEKLEKFIQAEGGEGAHCRSYVDYGPVLEKAFARRAGLGFIGKNTLLITEQNGSWVFLAVILTTLDLEAGRPKASECGSCRACLDACPTGALTAPYQLDARRCISYLTIENKGEIPEALQGQLNSWVFGCDICQEVCPYNDKPLPAAISDFDSKNGAGPIIDLKEILGLESDEAFRRRFALTPLLRPKRAGLQRNARALLKD